MKQSRHDKAEEKCFSSMSKLLDYEFSAEKCEMYNQSKESTSEQFYEQIFRHKTNLRRENHNLKREIQQTKQAILTKALGIYFNELKELNQNNLALREKHRLIYETKKPSFAIQPTTPRSPLQTPRSRRNVIAFNNNNNENSFPKPPYGENNLLIGRKSLNNSNIQNIRPKPLYGRNSLKISQFPKRNNEQLTQRKNQNSAYFSAAVSNNVSTFSESNSLRCSVKSRNQGLSKPSENIFTKFIDIMLQEQKQQQKGFVEIESEQKFFHRNHQENYTTCLQNQISKTSSNIQRLQNMLENYEIQIKKMQLNLSSVTDMTKQLGKIKQSYLMMHEKCKNIEYLRIQVATKQRRLKELKQNTKLQIFQPPQSIQMMLRLFGVQEANLSNPTKCKQQIKNIVRGNLEKPSKKKLKLKQLLDTVREGRKKFKQLMAVYEGRIKKLQRKLMSIRIS